MENQMDKNNIIVKTSELEVSPENDRKRCRFEEHLEPNVKVGQNFDKIMKMKVQCDLVILELKNKIEMLEEENKKLQCIIEKEQLNYQQLKIKFKQVLVLEESNNDKTSSITKFMSSFVEQIRNIKNFYKVNQANQDAARERMENTIKIIDEMKSSQQAMEAEYTDKLTTLQERLEDKDALINILGNKVVSSNINVTSLEGKIKDLQDMLDNEQSTNTVLNAHKEALKEEVAMWMQKCDQLKEESNQTMRQLNANLQELGRQYQAKCDELGKLSNELENVNELKTKLTYETDNIKEELKDKENYYIEQKSMYETKLNDIENEVKELREDYESTRVELESNKATLQEKIEMLESENKSIKEQNLVIENQLADSAEELRKVKDEKEDLESSLKNVQQCWENDQIKWEEEREDLDKAHSQNIRLLEVKESVYVEQIKDLENQILIKTEEYEHIEHKYKMLLSNSKGKPKVITKKRVVKDARVLASPQVGSSSTDQTQRDPQEIKNFVQPKFATPWKRNIPRDVNNAFDSDSDSDTDSYEIGKKNLTEYIKLIEQQRSPNGKPTFASKK